MDYVRSRSSGLGEVTDGAARDWSGIPLQFVEFNGIIRLAACGNGMGAVMAAFTVYSTVPLRKPVQGLVLIVLVGCRLSMAAIAARFI
jgi:hypothetical protein